MTQTDIPKPTDDPYGLIGDSWPSESESSYHAAKVAADDSSTAASTQSEGAADARSKMEGESGQTASAVSDGYGSAATHLSEQSRNLITISAWMTDAAGTVLSAKRQVVALVRSGTSEIKDALTLELQGTPASPSSNDLITQYRSEIASAASKLANDLDSIGHSLHGDLGSSHTPSYISVPTTPSAEHTDPRATVAAYNSGQSPEIAPTKLPEMPRALSAPTTESASAPSAPATPSASTHPVNPTLANLIGGQSTGTPSASSPGGTSSPHTSSSQGAPSTQAHQAPEHHHQDSKAPGLPRIPSIPLPDIPSIPLDTIATAVSSATAHQLPTAAPTPSTPSVPASTGFTPGTAGTSPMTPVAPGLAPIGGGGGLSAPPVTQPASQATPAAVPAAPQQTPVRGPAADLGWIQRTYGLAPGIETPKPESVPLPPLFIADLPEDEAHLHRVLATIRQAFEQSGWSQSLAVATLKRGFETRTVYVTADGVSIHPQGVLLPDAVTPLDEMSTVPAVSDLSGSLMVTDKIKSLTPRGWGVEAVLSTVPADEQHQSAEQYRELVEAEELLPCAVSRGRVGVTAEVAMSVFAHAALGSGGCGELGVESARLKAARWIGIQPVGYGEALGRWYLADAAESMSAGRWGEAGYCSEKCLELGNTKKQAA